MQNSTGVFINGRSQVIEMLRLMEPAERDRLLKNIRLRNKTLADELVEESLSFFHIETLGDIDIKLLMKYVTAPILGVALKNVNVELQRRILTLAPRNYAEEAYRYLITPIANEKDSTARAQKKVVSVLVALNKKNQIRLN